MQITFVSTFPPQRCGIGTFTSDLFDAAVSTDRGVRASVVAMTDADASHDDHGRVRFEIRRGIKSDYARAAKFVNFSDAAIVSVQHEYGIFGGRCGAHILDFLAALQKPSVTTLHTVLKSPSTNQRTIVRKIAERSRRVVVMGELAVELLRDVYGLRENRIAMIPHGIPDMPLGKRPMQKDAFGVTGRRVLLTFGLLGPNKGVETVIRALPALIRRHPDSVYLVVGATHPDIRRRSGEQYRNALEREAEALGVGEHVVFRNQFVDQDELRRYLQAADIYITPYLNEAQITSGSLAYAMGSGAAVVSTPYWHAQELLGDGRGRLFDFADVGGLADALDELLSDEAALERMQLRSYEFSRRMIWPRIGAAYVELAREVLAEAPVRQISTLAGHGRCLPELRLDHVVRMTDDTGMLQHAVYSVPDRRHGYCVDDNARALLVALLVHRIARSNDTRRLIPTYLSFLHHAQGEDGRFRNLMDFGRVIDQGSVSEDCDGRALWALGAAAQLAPGKGERDLARQMFLRTLSLATTYGPRGQSFAILGLDAFLRDDPDHEVALRTLRTLGTDLMHRFDAEATDEWRWFEPQLTYDNAVMPLALFKAYASTGEADALRIATESLGFLEGICFVDGHLTLIGNAGWYRRGGEPATFDGQPIDAAAFVLAYRAAYLATGDDRYLRRMEQSFEWFLGANRLGVGLYDFSTAGCRDGLLADSVSLNEGAESTLSFLISLVAMLDLATHQLDIEREDRPDRASANERRPVCAVPIPGARTTQGP